MLLLLMGNMLSYVLVYLKFVHVQSVNCCGFFDS